ncbi:MAG TPA: hypothetical protein VFH73_00020 [Polyangia bacterium]|nr:hypothetical protein [Polyangia bacterium]
MINRGRLDMEPTAESIVATLGIAPFLARTARLHRYVLDQAGAMPARVVRKVRAFLGGREFSEPHPDLPEYDHGKVGQELLETGNAAQASAILDGFPDQALANDVINQASRVIHFLQPLYPRRVRETLTGPVEQVPSRQTLAAFRRAYHVACEPMLVLRDMAEGSLSRDQVRALEQMYPELYRIVGAAITAGLVAVKARKGAGWTLPRRKELAVKTMLGADGSSPMQLAAYQRSFAKSDKPERPRAGGAGRVNTEALLTPGQRHA